MLPQQAVSVFSSSQALEEAQRSVKAIALSDLVPPMYRSDTPKGVANSLFALDISRQLGISVLTVMQNLQLVEGVPSWKSSYLIERFAQAGIEPEYEMKNEGKKQVSYIVWTGSKQAGTRRAENKTVEVENVKCRFVANKDGKKTFGTWVSVEMAIQEGWYFRNGSKWQTMTEKMLRYAAAREFNRFYPVVALNNIPTEESISDDWDVDEPGNDLDALNNQFKQPEGTEVEDAEVEEDGDSEEEII